jgi:hypothetical protein
MSRSAGGSTPVFSYLPPLVGRARSCPERQEL